ncbi:sigma-70 family RNA polymerase sigma factor [uncultured Arcticibacterium sp.]|uniref:RNA polymerase sigma factor n=1 Tax=uncultured Arcticibacterium sp. TaxID=2173042 RepID=UPI0030F86F70
MLKTIELLKSNNPKAQKEVFEKYSDVLFSLAKRYMGNAMAAEDMVVNAFMSIFKSASKGNFENARSFEAWMKRIVVNECLSEIRRNNSFQMLPQSVAENLALEPDVLKQLAHDDILVLVEKLPPGYRTVFNMYVMEGYSHKEIAKDLGISEGTSKSQLSHAKKMLRNKITNIYGKETRFRY